MAVFGIKIIMIQSVMFHSLWAYRGFILANVRRELQQRYTNSLLGGLWAVLNPLSDDRDLILLGVAALALGLLFVEDYNTVRLHSALGYITPIDQMEGRAAAIFAEQRRKLSMAKTAASRLANPHQKSSRLHMGNGRLSYADRAKFRFTLNQNTFSVRVDGVVKPPLNAPVGIGRHRLECVADSRTRGLSNASKHLGPQKH